MATKNFKTTCLIALLLLLAYPLLGRATEIYVSDAGNFNSPPWQILKFDEKGENPEVFIDQNLGWPQDIVFLDGAGTVLISNLSTNQITRYDAGTGNYIDVFANVPGGPTRMKIGNDGLLYVLQWNGNGKVLRYSLDGSFVDEFTTVGVARSIGMDWDTDGNLYVSSYSDGLVRKFGTNGSDLGVFINSNLVGPTNITVRDSGEWLVSDYDGGKVERFDANGSYIGRFFGGVSRVEGIDIFNNGNILVGLGGQSSVRMYDKDGNFIETLIASGSENLIAPNAIVIRNDNSGFKINAGLNDAWFNPATDGQGFFITYFPDLGVLNLAWFTYDTSLPAQDAQSELGDAGHRWLTAIGPVDGQTAVLNVSSTSGGLFDTASEIIRSDDGTITISFTDCKTGLVEYDIPSINRTGSVPIIRIANDNVGLCEALQ